MSDHRSPARQFRLRHFALTAVGAMVLSSSALAASDTAAINQKYKDDVAACNSGRTQQDKRTCMQEAGAAKVEAQRNRLAVKGTNYEQNAMQRCMPLPAADRAACEAQMAGQGQTYGSVAGGGILREMTIQVPAGSTGAQQGYSSGQQPMGSQQQMGTQPMNSQPVRGQQRSQPMGNQQGSQMGTQQGSQMGGQQGQMPRQQQPMGAQPAGSQQGYTPAGSNSNMTPPPMQAPSRY